VENPNQRHARGERREGSLYWTSKSLTEVREPSEIHPASTSSRFLEDGHAFAPILWVTAAEFAGLSAQLLGDMRDWIAEASKDETVSSSELAVLQTAMMIIERGTFKGTETKPDTTN